MQAALKQLAKEVLPQPVVNWIKDRRNVGDEVAMVAYLCRKLPAGTMVDVGGHFGTSAQRFLDLGWSVVAYEPDPKNRAEFVRNIGSNPRVQLSTCAVSNEEKSGLQLFSSPVSTGISGLSAFHESHVPTATVDVVRLDHDLKRREVSRVDFLKIDIEGFDFFALQGFDWTMRPRFALYEFENHKTKPLGYTLADSAAYMQSNGYHLLYSVWEPIVQYGVQHTWRGLSLDQPADVEQSWGNVLCFRDRADRDACMARYGRR
jgi:FkbM family methyltransferase